MRLAAVKEFFNGSVAVFYFSFRRDKEGYADRGKIKQPADFVQRVLQILFQITVGGDVFDRGAAEFDAFIGPAVRCGGSENARDFRR